MTVFNRQIQISISLLEYTLIILSAVLLGIWAVENTIALRNILLVIGFIISIMYFKRLYQDGAFRRVAYKNWIPFLLIGLMFFWVIAHYFIFSRYTEIQLQELRSTWLRAFLAATVGASTGFALQKKWASINLLWLGIGLSFTYLFFQYLLRVYVEKNVFVIDWYGGYYIYKGKINGVLMGSLLFCGLGSAWIDRLRLKSFNPTLANTYLPLAGMALTLYAYVFVFDTRNGLGIAFLLVLAWTLYAVIWFLMRGDYKNLVDKYRGVILTLVIAIGVFSSLAYKQVQHNSGWLTMAEDVKIASQIEKYPNWQNPGRYGYPKTDSGRPVAGNTYERVAWALAGFDLIPQNIFGIGLLTKPFNRLLLEKYPGSTPGSTHSAWIEFTLAFGVPGLFFLFGTLVSILYLTITSPGTPCGVSVISITLMLMLLYALGELSTAHGVEILFYLMALLAGLRMPSILAINKL